MENDWSIVKVQHDITEMAEAARTKTHKDTTNFLVNRR
jgi:hypothetical protein